MRIRKSDNQTEIIFQILMYLTIFKVVPSIFAFEICSIFSRYHKVSYVYESAGEKMPLSTFAIFRPFWPKIMPIIIVSMFCLLQLEEKLLYEYVAKFQFWNLNFLWNMFQKYLTVFKCFYFWDKNSNSLYW